MTATNLTASMEIILDSLPLEADGQLQRKHTLTRADAILISNMITVATTGQACSIGLTPEQAAAIKAIPAHTFLDMKDMVKERKRLLNALGAVTLGLLALIGKWLFTAIDWHRIWHILTGKP